MKSSKNSIARLLYPLLLVLWSTRSRIGSGYNYIKKRRIVGIEIENLFNSFIFGWGFACNGVWSTFAALSVHGVSPPAHRGPVVQKAQYNK